MSCDAAIEAKTAAGMAPDQTAREKVVKISKAFYDAPNTCPQVLGLNKP